MTNTIALTFGLKHASIYMLVLLMRTTTGMLKDVYPSKTGVTKTYLRSLTFTTVVLTIVMHGSKEHQTTKANLKLS